MTLLHTQPFLTLLPAFLTSTQSPFGDNGRISPPLQLSSESNHQQSLPSPQEHLQAECSTAETHRSPTRLSCRCSLLAHRTRAHVAHIRGWHTQLHSLHKMLQGQKHVSLRERSDQREVHAETDTMRRRVKVGTDQTCGARQRDRFVTKFKMGIAEAESGCCHAEAEGISTQREGRASANGRIC